MVLASGSGLESGGIRWGHSEEGTTQGDPISTPYFNVSWEKEDRELNKTLNASGGMGKFGMDDSYALGPADIVFLAFGEDQDGGFYLATHHNPKLDNSGALVNGQFEPRYAYYGVPIGTDII